jgi:hypothetical protein
MADRGPDRLVRPLRGLQSLEVRLGLHTGECEVLDGNVTGVVQGSQVGLRRHGTGQAAARNFRTGWLVNRDAILLLVTAAVQSVSMRWQGMVDR